MTVTHNDDGTIDVSIGSGRSLVVGANTFALTAASTPPQGFAQIISDGAAVPTDVTSEITGGRIAGLLQVRDVADPAISDSARSARVRRGDRREQSGHQWLRPLRHRRREFLRAAVRRGGCRAADGRERRGRRRHVAGRRLGDDRRRQQRHRPSDRGSPGSADHRHARRGRWTPGAISFTASPPIRGRPPRPEPATIR